MNDINRLRAQWEGIEAASTSTKTLAPELLYGEPDLTIKVVRDVFNEDFSKLIVSGEDAWDTIEAYVTYVAPDLVSRLEKWESDEDIFGHYRLDEQIRQAVRLIAVSGVPGETTQYQHDDLFDIDWDAFEQDDEIAITHLVAIDESPRFSAREAAALIGRRPVVWCSWPETKAARNRSMPSGCFR